MKTTAWSLALVIWLASTVYGDVIYSDVTDGRFNSAATWQGNSGYPLLSGDTGEIDSNLVTALVAGEVAAGVEVSVLDTGVLRVGDGATNTLATILSASSSIILESGGTLRISGGTTSTKTITAVPNSVILYDGGKILFDTQYSHLGDAALTTDITIDGTVYMARTDDGSGNSSKIYGAISGSGTVVTDGRVQFNDSTGSTYTGDYWVRSGLLYFYDEAVIETNNNNMRISSGATAYIFGGAGNRQTSGTYSGKGTLQAYNGRPFTFLAGGDLTVGDVGDTQGVTFTFTHNGTTSTYDAELIFASDSFLDIDVFESSADLLMVTAQDLATATFQAGSKIRVKMWTPTAAVDLGDGRLIVDSKTLNWAGSGLFTADAGWAGLAIVAGDAGKGQDPNDLYVVGSYSPVPEPATIAFLGLGGVATLGSFIRRRRHARR